MGKVPATSVRFTVKFAVYPPSSVTDIDCPATVRACVWSNEVKSNQQMVDAKSPLFADESAYPHPLGAPRRPALP
jgi:hypothetical protein